MSERSWYDRALKVTPLGSQTRSKAPGRIYPVDVGPRYAGSVRGANIQCVDGDWYLDMLCALGAVSIGYEENNLDRSGVCSLPFHIEITAAEKVLERVAPWASQVRFVRTGSEATTGALLVARRATGRKDFCRLHGSYHGWHPEWQDDADRARWFNVGEMPDASGAAAVIIEPPRWESFDRSWLLNVYDVAHAAGALVIIDEMIYGGRWALGGAIEYYDAAPDLACFGKALGNGAPAAMIVGMEALAAEGEAVSGTFSGDFSALRTLQNTIDLYAARDVVDWMWRRGRQLRRGLVAEIEISGVAATVEGEPVHQRIKFESEEIGFLFSSQMIQRGILWHPACTNLMRAHSCDDIERVIDAAGESLRVITGGNVEGAGA